MPDTTPARKPGRPSNAERLTRLEHKVEALKMGPAGPSGPAIDPEKPVSRAQYVLIAHQAFASRGPHFLQDVRSLSATVQEGYQYYLDQCKDDGSEPLYDELERLRRESKDHTRESGKLREDLANAKGTIRHLKQKITDGGMTVPEPVVGTEAPAYEG